MTKWDQQCRKRATQIAQPTLSYDKNIYFKQKSRISYGGFEKCLHSSLAYGAVRRLVNNQQHFQLFSSIYLYNPCPIAGAGKS
ncbi:hypothetical protein [Brevibacillus formosus]|uniref:hypothetical protein n=1 Tax=Brevibacillus formosus TaxID=54913 RepID=UPI003F1A9D48